MDGPPEAISAGVRLTGLGVEGKDFTEIENDRFPPPHLCHLNSYTKGKPYSRGVR